VPLRAALLVALVSSVWLTLCDQLFHVRTDTLEYHWTPQVADQHVLVPVTFFLAGLVIPATVGWFGPEPRFADEQDLAIGFGIVTLAYLVSGLLPESLAVAYALVLLAAWAYRVSIRPEPLPTVMATVSVAVGGVLVESVLSGLGQFDYVHPDVAHVPWWLFPLYLHGALFAIDVRGRLATLPATSRS
jgi:hypothetical protein